MYFIQAGGARYYHCSCNGIYPRLTARFNGSQLHISSFIPKKGPLRLLVQPFVAMNEESCPQISQRGNLSHWLDRLITLWAAANACATPRTQKYVEYLNCGFCCGLPTLLHCSCSVAAKCPSIITALHLRKFMQAEIRSGMTPKLPSPIMHAG